MKEVIKFRQAKRFATISWLALRVAQQRIYGIRFAQIVCPPAVIWHFTPSPMEKEIKNKILMEILSQPSL
jgi:hypothetical protein